MFPTAKKIDFYASFFEEADITFMFFDKELCLVDINKAALELFSFNKEVVIGKHITALMPDVQGKSRYHRYKEVLETGAPFLADDAILQNNSGSFPVRIKAFKMEDGIGIILNNISDLKELMDELDALSYKSSHDMRAPIASILGLTNISETNVKDIVTANEYFELIQQQAETLDSILQQLTGNTLIRRKEKKIQEIDFYQLIKDVVKTFSDVKGIDRIHIKQRVTTAQPFYSDKLIVNTLFKNLIDNAIKYQNENIDNSYLWIDVEEEHHGIRIIMEDNGIGIAENLKKDLFKMFFRATEKSRGPGLGLYTVKNCIRKLNGKITLKSIEKSGTTFSIFLPNEKMDERK